MADNPKIAFIGAGSTIFMKNIIGDIVQQKALSGAHFALMDIDAKRLAESQVVVEKLISSAGVPATCSLHLDQREALADADFVVCAFQVGGYDPCTITDFEIPKEFGLRQTIADTIGIGGIMRGLRTVPYLWAVCEDMLELCPRATMLQYVNPMAINVWAIKKKYPEINVVGLCHSVQGTVELLSKELGVDVENVRYECAGINHISFFTRIEERQSDGSYRDMYPELKRGYVEGLLPREKEECTNKVRYEMMMRTGYYVTESSEHFAEYTPWFIKEGREDILTRFDIPLDEYPRRCRRNIERWDIQLAEIKSAETIQIKKSREYASSIVNSIWSGEPSVIHGNVINTGLITNLPEGCAVEVACLVDANGVQPIYVGQVPEQCAAIMQMSISVQELVVKALMREDREAVYHAAMMDPHTGAELDLDQIWKLVDELIKAHGEWLPAWLRAN